MVNLKEGGSTVRIPRRDDDRLTRFIVTSVIDQGAVKHPYVKTEKVRLDDSVTCKEGYAPPIGRPTQESSFLPLFIFAAALVVVPAVILIVVIAGIISWLA